MQNHFIVLLIVCLFGCNNAENNTKTDKNSVHVYPTISYLDIKLNTAGQLPSNPYILTFKNKNKKIVFCGVNHLDSKADYTHFMYQTIEKTFFDIKPNIAINEGGDVSKNNYPSKQKAVKKDGEIGLVKVLCDSLHIKTVNGDPDEIFEFSALLKIYSKGEFLAYIVTERLMWGIKNQHFTKEKEIETIYTQFVKNYIIKKGGVRLTKTEQSFDFYKTNYEKLLHKPFKLDNLETTNPFEPKGKFQEIGRKSKEIRDQFLLKTIDQLLDSKNTIFIVFGGWHLLTCKPGLEEIINRKR